MSRILHIFDREKLDAKLSGSTICTCLALLEQGVDARPEDLKVRAWELWTADPEGKLNHVITAHKLIIDYLELADRLYEMIEKNEGLGEEDAS
jgi:hypothetical protein